jgi:hypothetical protein
MRSGVHGLRTIIAIASAIGIASGLFSHRARAQSLPPDILKCTRVQDALMRLECFDRAVATDSSRGESPSTLPPAPDAQAAAAAPAASTSASAATTDSGSSAPVSANPAAFKHLKAKVVSLRALTDDARVTLDNGQVWEQIQPAPALLDLHAGVTITIDRVLGGYWLSDASGASMKVKEETP